MKANFRKGISNFLEKSIILHRAKKKLAFSKD